MICATVVTHPGLARTENQDCALVPGFCSTGFLAEPVTLSCPGATSVFAVIDGMGGQRAGGEASRYVAFHLAGRPADEDVATSLHDANRMLYRQMERDPRLAGMGATIAGVRIAEHTATVFNVGDARVYQYDDGYLMLLTTDDRSSPSSHTVTQSLGGADRLTAISPHTASIPAPRAGERLLICSDGLTEAVGFDDLREALSRPDAGRSAGLLLDGALRGGAPDNVTFILLEAQEAR